MEQDSHYNNSLYYNSPVNVQQNRTNEGAGMPTPLPEFGEGSMTYPENENQMTESGNQPETTRPGGNRPENNQPGTNRPESSQPGTNQPESNQPGTNRPESNQPGTNRPESSQPGTNRPVTSQPGTNRPVTSQPGTNRPVTSQPGTNRPVTSQPSNRPGISCPGINCPSGGIQIPVFPIFPSQPSIPSYPQQSFGQVRFLNASTNAGTVNIAIDGNAYAINSHFGSYSDYDWISDGFHTVTVRRASGPRSILLQQNFPFVAGQKVTMVLTDSAFGGLELIRVVDTGCRNLPNNSGCYRFANMTYSGSSFDLLLYGGETIFRNVGFQSVTSYKQAVAGNYQMYITSSNTYTFLTEIPIIMIGAIGTNANMSQPLLSFTVDINAGQNYTTYLIGNTWSDSGLRVITLED
ncbi:MAG: DUF4397 domain-containing protein [Brotaphodocola sp.]